MEGFEKRKAVRTEQQRRRGLLRAAARRHPDRIDPHAARLLAIRLGRLHTRRTRQRCSSPVYMREQRRRIAGAMLRFLASSGGRGALAAIHLLPRSGRIRPDQLAATDAAAMVARLRAAVRRARKKARCTGGWLICFIDGEHEPLTNTIQLHFHGLVSGDLINVSDWELRKQRDYRLQRRVVIQRDLHSAMRSFTYAMKHYWKSVGRPEGEEPYRHTRIPEPVHSQVLLWLDRYELADLSMMIGLEVNSVGQIVCTEKRTRKVGV